ASCGASGTSPLGTTFGGVSHAVAMSRRALSAARVSWIRPLFVGLVLVVIVVGFDGERLLGHGRLVLVIGGGRLVLGLLALFGLLFLFATEAEEVALDVRALLRLGRAVVAREGDALGVLGAL